MGGSLVEPVNILLPYKARFSWMEWGLREGEEEVEGALSSLIRPSRLFQLKWSSNKFRQQREREKDWCSPAEWRNAITACLEVCV